MVDNSANDRATEPGLHVRFFCSGCRVSKTKTPPGCGCDDSGPGFDGGEPAFCPGLVAIPASFRCHVALHLDARVAFIGMFGANIGGDSVASRRNGMTRKRGDPLAMICNPSSPVAKNGKCTGERYVSVSTIPDVTSKIPLGRFIGSRNRQLQPGGAMDRPEIVELARRTLAPWVSPDLMQSPSVVRGGRPVEIAPGIHRLVATGDFHPQGRGRGPDSAGRHGAEKRHTPVRCPWVTRHRG